MYTHKLLDPLLFFIFEYSNANLKHFLIFTLLSFTLIFKKEMKSLIYLIAKQKWRCLFSSRSIFSFIWQFNFVRSNPIIMQTKNYHWLHPDIAKIHIHVHRQALLRKISRFLFNFLKTSVSYFSKMFL